MTILDSCLSLAALCRFTIPLALDQNLDATRLLHKYATQWLTYLSILLTARAKASLTYPDLVRGVFPGLPSLLTAPRTTPCCTAFRAVSGQLSAVSVQARSCAAISTPQEHFTASCLTSLARRGAH